MFRSPICFLFLLSLVPYKAAFASIIVAEVLVFPSEISRRIQSDVDGDASGVNGTHGGGDLRLVADFVDLISGETPSISTTSLDDSVMGHYLVFKADEARVDRKVVELNHN